MRVIKEEISDIDAATILEHIAKNYNPGDVFEEDDLRNWALDHNFVEKEEE